jgi:hypothetical protein
VTKKEERIQNAMRRLAVYDSLQRKGTDDVGWIAHAYGIGRKAAEKIVEEARARMAADANLAD